MGVKFYQQGDVILVPASVPQGAKRLSHKVLAEGEATGHKHQAVADDVELFEDEDGVLYMSAPSGTEIQHEEHGTISILPNFYVVKRVREYDHFAEEARIVQD